GAGAENRRRLQGCQQLRLGQRELFGAALRSTGGGLRQHRLSRVPVGKDTRNARIRRLARKFFGIEHVVANDDAGARTSACAIGRELVSRPFPPSHAVCLLRQTKNFQSFLWPIWPPGTTLRILVSKRNHSAHSRESGNPGAGAGTGSPFSRG